ncbi:MAG TPA: TIGR00730 family Rossman fold protein [Vicinamibacteria bacterium]|nr:TIGR00730 family Rossman fold protein [Vicinamibacteria bacterium]
MRRVCVFCGSSPGRDPRYVAAAREMALALVARGEGLVFGGGSVGLMGVLADALLAAGGEALGVIPHGLVAREIAHRSLTEMRVVPSMHARKALMAELSDAFVALPGGFGTFEELLEMVTWAQLRIHRKPIGLLNVAGYYDSLIALVDHAVREGFVPPGNRGLILVDGEPGPLLDRLSAYQSPARPEWITPGEA